MIKKLKQIIITTFIFSLFPTIVSAAGYITYSDITADGKTISNSSMVGTINDDLNILEYDMEESTNYEFSIKGYELEPSETYTYYLKSEYKDYKKQYTGSQLLNGITITGDDGNSFIQSILKDSKGNEIISQEEIVDSTGEKYISKYGEVYFKFNDNYNKEGLDKFYKTITTNNKIKLKAIKPKNLDVFGETVISSALKIYNNDDYEVYGYINEGNGIINISDKRYYYKNKEYNVEFIYEETNSKIKNKLDEYAKKFDIGDEDIENKLFTLEDMETINYIYALSKYGNNIDMLNSVINYSKEFNNVLENSNVVALLDTRAGWDSMFTSGGFGFLNLKYNDVIYSSVEIAGVKRNNVIYIDNDTKDKKEDYIEAALKRIKEYIPNVDVEIKYAGQISDINFKDEIIKLKDIVDISKTLGEYYELTLNNMKFYFFIAKDSSKFRRPMMSTKDLLNKISIKTSSSQVPLDSKINTNIYDKDSKEYNELISKLGLEEGFVVDLKLYSNSINNNIDTLDNGNFLVYIPIDKVDTDDLNAYYIDSNGKIESHKVEIDGNYVVFETNHFSTFVLGKSIKNIDNPNTSDKIILYICLLVCAIINVGVIIYLRNKSIND